MIPVMLPIALLTILQPTAPLTDQFTAIAKTSGGRVGVFAQVIESQESAGLIEAERFPMQSVYKVPIAMAVLDQVDRKALTLNQKVSLSAGDMVPIVHSPLHDAHPRGGIDISVRDLIRAAIVDSDGTASDVLLRIAGGFPRVTAYLRGLGIRDMVVATTEREMSRDPMAQYRNYSTPRAAVFPSRVLSVPVLCATTVPSGSSPLIRRGPGVESARSCRSSVRAAGDTPRPAWSAFKRSTAARGVE